MELSMWCDFLSTWNGISFFYDKPRQRTPSCTQSPHPQKVSEATTTEYGSSIQLHLAPKTVLTLSFHCPLWTISCRNCHTFSQKSNSHPFTAVDIFNKGHHFIIHSAHIRGHQKHITNSLSWISFQKFKSLAADSDLHPTLVPQLSATIYT